ncbi:MAG: hypothetical protein JRD93_15705 [Deltaproteobacteria bacterium]|nr:hypothetical protein [Deltaproteobacteria bacterium]
MNFSPYKAIDIPRKNGRIDRDKDSLSNFWLKVDEMDSGVSEAVGCYIFSIRAGRGLLPWYVGLAEKQTFHKECFTIHKLINYNDALNGRKGTPVLTLIAKYTNTKRFAKPSKNGHTDIRFLENMLIGTCIRRNPNLLNIKKTKLLKEMIVPGLLNNTTGRDYSAVKEFRSLIGTSKNA